MDATTMGRRDLPAWKLELPGNTFEYDVDLSRMVRRVWGSDLFDRRRPALSSFGRVCADIDPTISELEHRRRLPRLERWDHIGFRTEHDAIAGSSAPFRCTAGCSGVG